MDPIYEFALAIGINPRVRIFDAFMEAEKAVGTIHVAFGGSYRLSKTHLDLLIARQLVAIFRELAFTCNKYQTMV